MPPERVVRFRPRTVLGVLIIILAVLGSLRLLWLAHQVLTWIFVAAFFAVALNPLVDWLQRIGIRRRGLAVGCTFVIILAAVAGVSATFLPTLINEVNDFATKGLPDVVNDITKGRGRLGFLETKYHLVDRVRDAVNQGGASRLLGLSGTAVAVTKGVITAVVAVITITVLTIFMLLEGPAWLDRFFSLLSPEAEARWRSIGRDVYRTVGGFVTGALTIAVLAGVTTTILLSALGVQYAFALGLVVALLDLIPLAGATLGAVIVTTVAGFDASWVIGLIVLGFYIVYQQVENHLLYPVVYSRTVQLSPLTILVAVLLGASLAGVLGALAAIPVAGTIQVVLRDILRQRRNAITAPQVPEPL